MPTPPEAITGTATASAIARVSGMSKPCFVPSRSIEVSRISPAPSSVTRLAQADGVDAGRTPAAVREYLEPVGRDGLRVDGDDDALAAEFLAPPRRTNSGRATAAVLIETLSAPASSSLRMSSTVRTPPPTVSGMKHCSAVRPTTS